MTRSEVISRLRREGYAATVGRVRQALGNGYMQPLPSKAARRAYDYQPEHLRQLRRYLVHVRPGPRPDAPMSLLIRGSNDRVRRLRVATPASDARARDNSVLQREGLATLYMSVFLPGHVF